MTILYFTQIEEFMLEPLAQSMNRDPSVGPVYLHRRPSDEVWARARSRLSERVQLRPVDDITHHRAVLQAEAMCVPITEALWREIPAAGQLARLVNLFFSDPHGEYALKKSLASDVESRLESIFTADILAQVQGEPVHLVPTSPLDQPIVEAVRRLGTPPGLAIRVWSDEPYRRAVERRWGRAGIWTLLRTLLWLGGMPLRRRLQWRTPASRPYFKVACDNKWTTGQHLGGRDDLFLVDDERIRRNDVLIICNGVQPDRVSHYRAAGVTAVSCEGLQVPVRFLLREFFPRILRFLVAAGPIGVRSSVNADLMRKAADLITGEFDFEVLLQYVRIGVLASIVEHSASHIVRTLILNCHGGRTIRLPHSQMDYPGAALAYLHYNVFCSSGEYLPTVWSSSWSPKTQAQSVGQMFNYPEDAPRNFAASDGADRLLAALRQSRRRLVTVFTGNPQSSIYSTMAYMDRDPVALVLECCAKMDDVVILIKLKPGHPEFVDQPEVLELLDPHLASGRVHLLHQRWGTDCSAQFAIRHSTACVAAGGSVVVEALCLGVPILVPLVIPRHITPFVRRFMGTVFFDDPKEFQRALRATLLGEPWPRPDTSFVREWFDPFCDGRAVDRIRDLVLSLNGQGGEGVIAPTRGLPSGAVLGR